MDHAAKVLSMQEDEPEVQEAVDVVTTAKLITKVVVAVSETVSAAAVVPAATVTAAPVKVAVASTRRRRRVVIRDPEEESSAKTPTETKKLHEELNQDIDWDVAIDHVKQKAKEDPYVQRDLWKVCNDYGTVVYVFIPNKKSKTGKRFASVRFIRPNASPIQKGLSGASGAASAFRHPNSYVNVVNGASKVPDSGPVLYAASTLVLDDSCAVERDLSKHVMGKVKDVNSISNLRTILRDEGFSDVNLSYLGGLWVLFECDTMDTKVNLMGHAGVLSWFHIIQNAVHDFVSDEHIVWVDIEGVPLNVWSRETFIRIGKKWGETLDIEDKVDSSFGRKRLCVKTKQPLAIFESFKVIFKGKAWMVCAKELVTWNPILLSDKETKYSSDDESVHNSKKGLVHSLDNEEASNVGSESDVEGVAETIFVDNTSSPINNFDEKNKQQSEDQFKIYDILEKQTVGGAREVSPSLSHPSGFTPEMSVNQMENVKGVEEFPSTANANVMNTSHVFVQDAKSDSMNPGIVKSGGSVLRVLEDMIPVGQAMGYKMDGCVEDLERIIGNQGADDETKMHSISHMEVKFMWGNSNYDYVYSEALGYSGGRWNGETFIMGDFNEVRSIVERPGSCFNPSSARAFDHFISSSGLVDVKLEGYAFTWSHPSGSKMSKLYRFLVSEGIFLIFPSISALCLERHLSDHRSILLCEVLSDFGPIPFRFYHSWFNLEGFEAMVEKAWRSFSHTDANRMIRFKKKMQDLKVIIRGWVKNRRAGINGDLITIKEELCAIDNEVDGGVVSDSILLRRMELQRKLYDFNQLAANDSFQKSKVKWAIEGDENSKFFHGIINRKRSHLAIRGVFDKGISVADPRVVKQVFCNHFESRFKKPAGQRLLLDFSFNNRLSDMQASDLERNVTRDEIRSAIWGCGENKSSGPDGLTLLKSVLGASPLYTMSIFKVPKGILKNMEMIRSNFFNGFDSSKRNITWAAWDKILASKENGGLGVLSFHALNRALLFKWVWRFISHDGSLWFRVIHALYGYAVDSHPVTFSSNWCSIVRELIFLSGKELDKEIMVADKMKVALDLSFRRHVRNGAEHQQLEELYTLMDSVSLSQSKDRWVFDLSGDGIFRINVFAWRARRDYLPTRATLNRRDVIWPRLLFVVYVDGGN
nr:RNA-directed DNA polymerase, eukaryota [Tanacetum cinerariifolium]